MAGPVVIAINTPQVANAAPRVTVVPPRPIVIGFPGLTIAYSPPMVFTPAPTAVAFVTPPAAPQAAPIVTPSTSASGAGAWIEGFEVSGNAASFMRRYALADPPTFVAGRNGIGKALGWDPASTTLEIAPPLASVSASSAILVGMGIWFDDAQDCRPIRLQFGILEQAALDFRRIDADSGYLRVRSGTVILGQVGPLPARTWYYVELKLQVHNTLGRFELRIDQVPVLQVSGVDTQQALSAAVDLFAIQLAANPGNGWRIDDLYVRKGGYDQILWWGDIKTSVIRPVANGEDTEWTPQELENWDEVDDETPDDEATYVAASNPATDLYEYENLDREEVSGRVKGVLVSTTRRAATAGLGTNLRSILFDEEEATEKTIGDSQEVSLEAWDEQTGIYDKNVPGRSWESQEVDRAQFGMRV